jgi:hypothetical protein
VQPPGTSAATLRELDIEQSTSNVESVLQREERVNMCATGASACGGDKHDVQDGFGGNALTFISYVSCLSLNLKRMRVMA